jgi:isopenicillin N synthase-like dioxygenase
MSQATPAVFDIAGLRTGDPGELAAVASELGKATQDNGFCHVVGYGIPDEVFDGLLEAAKSFFALYRGADELVHRIVPMSPGVRPAGGGGGYSNPDRFDRKEAFDTVVEHLAQFCISDKPQRRPVKADEHLFAQTAQGFQYLQRRMAAGDLTLPDGSAGFKEFGQRARQKESVK